jgi:hypothetical protein
MPLHRCRECQSAAPLSSAAAGAAASAAAAAGTIKPELLVSAAGAFTNDAKLLSLGSLQVHTLCCSDAPAH